LKHAKILRGRPDEPQRSAPSLDIGIINNMPDGALESTERQFLTLLGAAADGVFVRVKFYALPGIPRSDSGQRHITSFYSDIDDLCDRRLDGLIVTGTEPRASSLINESYWPALARVLDWAEHNTYSAIWSCLAAHAAVLHIDGISRRRLRDKRFGLFECTRASDHLLMAGLAAPVLMPHSRWNDLREDELVEAGYLVLTRSPHAGVDAFVKQRRSLFVFFQGHPEYEADSLPLEYLRDIGRYLREESDEYPTMPYGYFGPETVEALTELAQEAMRDRREGLLANFPATLASHTDTWPWRTAAVSVYTSWLAYLCAMKQRLVQAPRRRNGLGAEKEVLPTGSAVAATAGGE
jgi:homoserine O-succinyltransferase